MKLCANKKMKENLFKKKERVKIFQQNKKKKIFFQSRSSSINNFSPHLLKKTTKKLFA